METNMCNLENFRKNAASQSISCEIVGGHVVQSEMTGEDGHKLCFLLGTMMEDYLLNRKKTDRVLFGPVDFHLDESNKVSRIFDKYRCCLICKNLLKFTIQLMLLIMINSCQCFAVYFII